ncbi:MAG: hypothetical protein U1F72_02975 [Gammaproteobacteria bacterium]
MKRTGLGLATVVLMLAGCGGPAKDKAAADTGDREPASNGELLDAVRQPLERARAVEGIPAEHKQDMDARIEEQTR